MKRILALAILSILVSANAFAQSPPVTVTIISNPTAGSYVNGPITLTATIAPTGTAVTEVDYYASQTVSGTTTTTWIGGAPTSPYQITWTPPAGTYSLFAVASVATSGSGNPTPSPTGSTNGVIDLVGAGAAAFPSNVLNPVQNTIFGEPPDNSPLSPPSTPWVEGDNQMCSTDSLSFPQWPYNASNLAYPDGSCEWYDSNSNNNHQPPANYQTLMTLDGLDDAMHTLSDFDRYASSLLSKDVGTLSQTFTTWYSGAAKWIAPTCTGCNTFGMTCENNACNAGTVNGRLLSIYAPQGYPGITGVTGITTPIDRFKDWNTLITSWLNNSYASSSYDTYGAWCVPQTTTGAANEDNWINANSNEATSSATWGDLSHVIACLNFNAGPTPAQQSSPQYANYQTCLSELPQPPGTCPTVLPPDCPPNYDTTNGCDPTVAGSYASWLNNFSNQTPNSIYQQCLTALTAEETSLGSCPPILPAQCAPLGAPPKWNSTDSTRCDVFTVGSYANWASNGFNFGPMYNYQNCLNLLNAKCPTTVTGTVCDPSVLGRALEPAPAGLAYSGVNRCISTYTSPTGLISYAHWVKDNWTLFSDEQPKFLLRSAFLTDVYNRARTMQTTFTQGDEGLHSFLKSCNQCAYVTACPSNGQCTDGTPCGPPSCADGSTCSSGQCTNGTPCLPAGQCANVSACSAGKCPDGSACGAPLCSDGNACGSTGLCSDGVTTCNYCANGGPAAQLIFARTQPSPTDSLPNSVIYGWQDNIPTGRTGACTDSNGVVGCAHIVKVTAYSPARVGNGMSSLAGLQAALPNIYNWNTFWYDYFTLQNRDGSVYVSVKRWDQDHSNSVAFPNGHALWQYMFHNPTTGPALGTGGLPSECTGVSLTGGAGGGACTSGGCVGYGLEPQTVSGLVSSSITGSDQTLLGQAFMLNDNGNGLVDPSAKTADGKACASSGSPGNYCACLDKVNKLLSSGTESHACARYIAASPASDAGAIISGSNGTTSSTTDADYSLKYINCNSIDGGQPPEDLTY